MRFETFDTSCDVVLRYSGREGLHQKLHYDERNSVIKFGWEAHAEIPKLPLKRMNYNPYRNLISYTKVLI